MELLTALTIGAMFGIGIFQLLRRNVIRSVIGYVILSNAINLLLLSAGAYQGQVAPYLGLVETRSDALPRALILTAIVISMGGLAFTLGMVYLISACYRTSDSDEVRGLRR
jgi:multicomponent Na+:H+ antiporter subunit C